MYIWILRFALENSCVLRAFSMNFQCKFNTDKNASVSVNTCKQVIHVRSSRNLGEERIQMNNAKNGQSPAHQQNADDGLTLNAGLVAL